MDESNEKLMSYETPQKSGLAKQIENEIQTYLTGTVTISEDNEYSQPKLVRRISLFENHIYPSGKFDSQGNYKFWFDIQTPRANAEVKNIDFDTKDILVYSPRRIDELPNIVVNLKLKEYLRETGQAGEINSAIEEGSAWGNIVWKKVRGTYERADLRNFYVINQTAETLNESPAIERHQMSQTDLRRMDGKWYFIKEVIKECKTDSYSSTIETQSQETTMPYYEIYERNGEVCLYDLKEYRNENPEEADKEKYVLAKVIASGIKSEGGSLQIKYILFANKITKMPYKEYHRGRYKGRWWREGIIELLFDLQVRANQIGNQLAQGLEWSSKTIFASADKLIYQNILSDLKNGDIIKSQSLQQVQVRMEGFDQLVNDWNRVLQLANDICNSHEVVQSITPASGTPLGTTQLLNSNANKLFDFLREKLAIPLSEIFEEWIVPELVNDLKAEEILRLTGDSRMLERLNQLIVDDWYLKNLPILGRHTNEVKEALKEAKMEELRERPQILMERLKDLFEDFKPSVSVVITGENSTLPERLETYRSFIELEQDPIRRGAMIEDAMRMKGIDVGALPKTPPIQVPTAPTKI